MKNFALAGALALAVSACAQITDTTGLSDDQQRCVAQNAVAYVQSYAGDWRTLTLPQRAQVVADGVVAISGLCQIGIEDQPIIETALQAAALAE